MVLVVILQRSGVRSIKNQDAFTFVRALRSLINTTKLYQYDLLRCLLSRLAHFLNSLLEEVRFITRPFKEKDAFDP